ncbi:oligosaccharide flippase family protein [Bacillus nitratireducens]|uniref:oligosaccharide flippase family protein n=1 Tax=Bacillus nitratireducens TaxID=2026193 RepID=UPI00211D8143
MEKEIIIKLKEKFQTGQLLKLFKSMLQKAKKVGFLHLLSANMLLQIAGFGGQIFLTRILSVEEIGKIKVLQSFLGIIILIAGLGINVAILKLCSEKISDEEKDILFVNGFKFSIVISLFTTVTVVLLAFLGLLSENNEINNAMKLYIVQVPFLVMNTFAIFYLQSQKRVHDMSKIQSKTKIMVIVVSTLSAYFFGLYGYVMGIVFSNIVATVLCFSLLKDKLVKLKEIKVSKVYILKLLNISGVSFVTNLMGQLVISLNILLLSYMSKSSAEIGYYGIAQLIITSMMIIPNTLNQIMIPYLSEKSDNEKEIKKILSSYQKRMRILIFSLFVATYFIVPAFMPVVFGEKYSNSIVYFRILLVGMVFWSLYSPKGITLVSIGKVDYNFYTSMCTFIINILLNIVLIIKFDVMGAALATMLTYFITIFFNNYFFKKALIKKYSTSRT